MSFFKSVVMDSNLWSRRTKYVGLSVQSLHAPQLCHATNVLAPSSSNSKLSLSTPGSQSDPNSLGRNSFPKRFGGDSSSHGTKNPFNTITTPGGGPATSGLASPGGASFGLGTGAFSAFGAKTPKSPGNPFDSGLKTPGIEKTAKDAANGSDTANVGGAIKAGAVASASATTKNGVGDDQLVKHPLRNSWSFWYRPPIPKNVAIPYEDTVHGIATCDTVEDFWTVYRHLKYPSSLNPVSDYHLFKKGIRPIWEDEENRRGGKWVVRLKKGVADRYWENLMLALIGDQFGEAGEEVCGAVLSVRNGEDIISIWTASSEGKVLKIR